MNMSQKYLYKNISWGKYFFFNNLMWRKICAQISEFLQIYIFGPPSRLSKSEFMKNRTVTVLILRESSLVTIV